MGDKQLKIIQIHDACVVEVQCVENGVELQETNHLLSLDGTVEIGQKYDIIDIEEGGSAKSAPICFAIELENKACVSTTNMRQPSTSWAEKVQMNDDIIEFYRNF
ncbi:MAG: hypothetical protein EAY65_05785 [Alphaproteobacteria bacterium]|nr:MAG: hypothetical protein EAY65_05785 [Alphaproteobacteria bacterium]